MKGKKQESTEKDVIIGRMPIMLRSCSCVLYGKDEEQLAKLEECPLGPRGYLVINDTEKVISIQEQLSKNRIIIDTDNKGCVQASVISSSEKTKRKTIIKMEKEKDILLISPVICLRDIFLANVPVHQHNFCKKCIYVPVMMRRMMEEILNKDAMDDKDYVGNKRLELSGQLLSLLFEDLFKTMNSESKRAFDASSSARDILYCIKKYNRITLELGRALSTGNWDVKRFGMHKKGVTDVVARWWTVCRPLVIADRGVSRIKELHMKELRDGVRDFNSFLRDGLIEYLDVNEENNSLIALYEKEATMETTHIEIEAFTILGVCACLIPYPHHNQSPRNTYQCAMGKQAMGNIAYDQLNRMDDLLYLLVYPQRPLLKTRAIELVGYEL
ncbi:putative germin-like protein 2-3-like [Capsicum annuum]|uniref:DNA-directed RNA polymerase n=1 Tax=Capsicum annuum TaxID=4072 RepID=A0A2G2Y0V6_CAPAN|nr:putative germin-like protein 2-3-like [Capsicum annuum]PHT63373.1 hypothetical protein T459_32737 [Capsicum annuum]